MEMEHINENTIRVLIGHEDLEERAFHFGFTWQSQRNRKFLL